MKLFNKIRNIKLNKRWQVALNSKNKILGRYDGNYVRLQIKIKNTLPTSHPTENIETFVLKLLPEIAPRTHWLENYFCQVVSHVITNKNLDDICIHKANNKIEYESVQKTHKKTIQ